MNKLIRLNASEHSYLWSVDFTDLFGEIDEENMIIAGNEQFKSYGDESLIDIVMDSEDVIQALFDATGKTWQVRTIRGSVQREWQDLYLTDKAIDDMIAIGNCFDTIDEIEDFYFNKYDIFKDEDGCHYNVPHSVSWEGNDAIFDYLGINECDVYDEGDEDEDGDFSIDVSGTTYDIEYDAKHDKTYIYMWHDGYDTLINWCYGSADREQIEDMIEDYYKYNYKMSPTEEDLRKDGREE